MITEGLDLRRPDSLKLVRISTRIKSLVVRLPKLLLNFKRKSLCAGDIVHTKKSPFVKRVITRASLCLPRWRFHGRWLSRLTIKILVITRHFFHDYRLKLGNFYVYWLIFLAVFRRSVNLIENYFICIKNRVVTGAKWILLENLHGWQKKQGIFLHNTVSAFVSCYQIFLKYLFYCRVMVQFCQLQAALHIIPGKCSARNSAWGAAKLSISRVWLSCSILHFGKCIYWLRTGLKL